MICNATSIKKYLDKSPKIFFLYGSEIVLINDSADQINDLMRKYGRKMKRLAIDRLSHKCCDALKEKGFILVEGEKIYLLYAVRGENGIAIAKINIKEL